MKITVPLEIELEDWLVQGKLTLRQHLGDANDNRGNKFNISQSGLTFFLEREGGDHPHHQAIIRLGPVIEILGEHLVDNAEKIAAEPKREEKVE